MRVPEPLAVRELGPLQAPLVVGATTVCGLTVYRIVGGCRPADAAR